jgi:hypothetical protein
VITEICFYSGIVSLSLLFGAAAVINPLGAGLLALGFYGVAKNA